MTHPSKTRHILTINQFLLIGLTIMLALMLATSFAQNAFAQGPGDPVFRANSYAANDGSVRINTQEAVLDSAYFSAHGTLDGLSVTSQGLQVANGATTGTYTSDPIASPLGVTTDLTPLWNVSGGSATIETRQSSDGFNWSPWVGNPETFYPVKNNDHAGTMIWIGSYQPVYVQVRVTLNAPAVLNALTLTFGDASQGPADATIAAQLPFEDAAVCPVERPYVVSRTQWGSPDGQYSPRWVPQQTDVTHFIIAHTATPNDLSSYGVSDWAAVVRATWNFHANTLGWGDIGYNYLIDPNGVIYEGRAGNQNGLYDIVGAHDGLNTNSMGLAFIGCYGNCETIGLPNANPPQPMMNKGVELVAWKVGDKGLDPTGYGYYHNLWLPTIAGARDVYPTYSPGDILYYNWLPWMRDAVQDRVDCGTPLPCRITDITFDKASYQTGEAINLSAHVVDPYGNPLSGAQVTANVSVIAAANGSINLNDQAGTYTGTYYDTATAGTYIFNVTAAHPLFQTCSLENSVAVIAPTTCQITARVDPALLNTPGAPVSVTAEVSLNGQDVSNAAVSARITRPDSGIDALSLPWQGGRTYRANYANTLALGTYNLTVEAVGNGFDSCQTTTAFTVNNQPADTVVRFNPAALSMQECDAGQSNTLDAVNVSDLSAFSFQIRFDPNVATVIDADPVMAGVQITLGSAFASQPNFVVTNSVDNVNGVIDFAATLMGGASVSGDVSLVEIDWAPNQAGISVLNFDELALTANSIQIPVSAENGSIEVTGCGGSITGRVFLQGRVTHAGVTIANNLGAQTQTDDAGAFSIDSGDSITVNFPGFLSGEALNLQDLPVDLGTLTLLAGDVNGDDIIDIFDLAYMAIHYRTDNPTADLNADGIVNIVDLALAASNYRQRGPLSDWQ